jgi:hypothetical protein
LLWFSATIDRSRSSARATFEKSAIIVLKAAARRLELRARHREAVPARPVRRSRTVAAMHALSITTPAPSEPFDSAEGRRDSHGVLLAERCMPGGTCAGGRRRYPAGEIGH